ncbi:MAG: DegT/DnrJ/EryC1/StrS family aminotransferase [Candidatus Omnitrophica bacterium]|nr:DegT/DnrJ/EryC1/StrS family aminotransferase [Candidatus Omnitrophota bacterium]
MNIPILDVKRQIRPIRRQLDAAIKRVIDNANFVFGSEIKQLEEEVAGYSGAKYAVAVSNGTDAIRLALLAQGVKQGDKVICPDFTYYATAGAIASVGAIPVFADIYPDTYNISIESTETILKKQGKKIKAIVPVHLFGQCADMKGIMGLAKKYDLKVVEDNAQAFGAEFRGKKAGTIGDCGAVSFFPGKNLGAFGDAGMVLTNNKSVANRLYLLRNQGNIRKYHHLIVGYNNRMDTLQAAVLRVKLAHLDSWNTKRLQNAAYFNRAFEGLGIKTPVVSGFSTHIYHQYVLRLDNRRDTLVEYLRAKGIDARVYYPLPLHLQECFKYLGYKAADFPESIKASKETLAIPVYPDMTKQERNYIAACIERFLK